MPTVVKVPEG